MGKIDYLRAFVLRGKNRKDILHQLKEGEKTQAQIHHSTKLYRTHIRRTIRELEKKKLIKCLNPKDRIYKLYVLTKNGKNVLRYL